MPLWMKPLFVKPLLFHVWLRNILRAVIYYGWSLLHKFHIQPMPKGWPFRSPHIHPLMRMINSGSNKQNVSSSGLADASDTPWQHDDVIDIALHLLRYMTRLAQIYFWTTANAIADYGHPLPLVLTFQWKKDGHHQFFHKIQVCGPPLGKFLIRHWMQNSAPGPSWMMNWSANRA